MSKSLPNPSDVANKWASSMGNAGTAYTKGVQSVTTSPGQTAAANVNAYLTGVQNAVTNGSYQKGLTSFTLADWQNAAVTKGASRLGSGAQASKGRMQTFFSSFLPQLQTIQQQIQSMPSDTYDARKARANALMDALHNLKGNFKTK